MMCIKCLKLLVIFILGTFFNSVSAKEIPNKQTNETFFSNQELLDSIFEKLYKLESHKEGKINIVHIGDSHIQADFLTDVIRKSLQKEFGDGGYGFSFPYSLARTNGTKSIKYSSTANWKSRFNVSPVSSIMEIGLSGIGLSTNATNFKIQISTVDELSFNSIKVLYSTEYPQYQMSLSDVQFIESLESQDIDDQRYIIHQIKRGETLSAIATNYKTTINAIKQENKLASSDIIQAGATLRIPKSYREKTTIESLRLEIDYLVSQNYPYYASYISSEPLNQITIYSNENSETHDINGFVFENDKPGLIYHCIGVNGAKLSDYIKYPLFFKQLSILKPDLIVLSLGTNESYQKLSTWQYVHLLETMINNVRSEYPYSMILVMTPPPSLVRRRTENTLVADYSSALMQLNNIPVWDLYHKMGGTKGILPGGKYTNIMAKDKIHYTIKGYQIQGEMFANDFLQAYKQFKQKKVD